jgi:hypothetical protein
MPEAAINKTAKRLERNTKSGLPNTCWCRQPIMRLLKDLDQGKFGLPISDPRIRDMTSDLFALVNTSA